MSTRTERAIDTGQFVVEELLREPVRNAVREALAEEGIEPHSSPTDERSRGATADGGNSYLTPKLLVPLIAVAAAMFYARRRRSSGEAPTEGMTAEAEERAAAPTGRSAGRTESGMPGEGESEEAGDERETDGEGTDEEAAAR